MLSEKQGIVDPDVEGHVSTFVWLDEDRPTLVRYYGAYKFVPLISPKLNLVADLSITLLRPESPGGIVQSGDLDNRLKTLFDALKVPNKPDDLPKGVPPSNDEIPFFCLLEDDELITGVNVRTDRLLDPNAKKSEVLLLIRVRSRPTIGTPINIGLV